jgi:hypothetical protein
VVWFLRGSLVLSWEGGRALLNFSVTLGYIGWGYDSK